jgi:hypothetical protein
MATKQYSARISKRNLWIAAAELGMTNDSQQDVAKVCFLVSVCHMTPENAKREVAALRQRPDTYKESQVFSLKIPEEWTAKIDQSVASLGASDLVRYALARIVDESHETALENSKSDRKPGRPRKTEETKN